MSHAAPGTSADVPLAGVRIANSQGVPGTIGFIARTRHDGQAVIVTAHHVLLAKGARRGDVVWCVEDSAHGLTFRRLGRTLYGRSGVVDMESRKAYVDCAVTTVEWADCPWPAGMSGEGPGVAVALAPGDRVTKTGAATGTTEGIVVETRYEAPPVSQGGVAAIGQILVRSAERGRRFSEDGDSGAALLDEHGALCGLLWAVTPRGESLVCPIDVVLYVLNVVPMSLSAEGWNDHSSRGG